MRSNFGKGRFPNPAINQLILVSSLLFTLISARTAAQVPTVQDCLGAIPVCQDIYVQETTYLGTGNYPNEIFNPAGNCVNDCPGSCLDGEQNSVWYVFTVQTGGMLSLTIDPFFDADDYDWAVYDISTFRCTDIYAQYSQMQKSCNAWGSSSFNGNTGISTANGGNSHCNHCGDGSGTSKWNADLPVVAGRTYVLVIENWGTTPQGGYTLDFSASTASIYDNVRPMLDEVHSGDISCGDNFIKIDFSENVMCSSVDPSDFLLSGPGGPYAVTGVQGQTCLLGGEMEKTYTLFLDRAIGSDGDYALQLTPLNFVYDACNNFALGNTVSFSVSLGAPVISTYSMSVQAATCGLSNGAITGIVVTGTPPYSFLWTDQNGVVVGTQLDLLNVPSGNYTLTVSDNNTCQTVGGPYYVDQTGEPALDATALIITGANFGANNGHITGLTVTGNQPFTYLWTDEGGNPVGTELDLHDVYSGNYYLLVTDAYGCETLGGPYFVDQIGGPLGVFAMAFPDEICIGGSAVLNVTPYGGTGSYQYSWTSDPPGFISNLQSPVVYPEITTIYTLEVTDGYVNVSTDVTVTVIPLPLSAAGADQLIPYGTSTTLFGSAGGGTGSYQYAWEPADQLISPNVQNPATKNLYQTTLFRMRVTDEVSGCVSRYDTVVVSLNGGPLGVTVSAQDDTICRGESTVITAYGFGGNFDHYSYKWMLNGQTVKEEQGPVSTYNAMPPASGDYLYTVEIFDQYNTYTGEVTLHVAQSPAFIISGGPTIVACPFDVITLKPNMTYPGASYYWSNGAVTQEIQIGSTGIGFESRMYVLEVENSVGCSHNDSVMVIFDFSVCTGIGETEPDAPYRIYPNPSGGEFTVEFDDAGGFESMKILNVNSQVVYEKSLKDIGKGSGIISVSLSGQPAGLYVVRMAHERYLRYHKLIVQ